MFTKLLNYLVLPREITAFEASYLARMNRVALLFFLGNVPLFMVVAALSGTGILKALAWSLFALVGPTIAYFTFKNPRRLSYVFGFTAMCMGGFLVYFGQGPMQIEMHFYFFVLIALLSVFANPIVIVIAAATVAAHHLAVYLLYPQAVFNYEASVWTVVVHALFVVFESIAACFVARSFFDNVIGLEAIVGRRTTELAAQTRDMRLVLDNVEQGLLTVAMDGGMSGRSACIERWFGAERPKDTIWDYLGRTEEKTGAWLRLGWEAIVDDMLPFELSLDQLPKRIHAGDRTLDLTYKPIEDGGKVVKILVILTDVTASLERERNERDQREILAVFERVLSDKVGFLQFIDESTAIVRRLVDGAGRSLADVKRDVHTLKGTSSLFGLTSVVSFCHAIEDHLAEEDDLREVDALLDADRKRLDSVWKAVLAKLQGVCAGAGEGRMEIDPAEYDAVVSAVAADTPRAKIQRMLEQWKFEPARVRLFRVAEQVRAIGKKLHKGDLSIDVEANGVRLPAERWSPFWSAFTHLVRNAVDHGLEMPEARLRAGKPEAGHLALRTKLADGKIVIEIEDDGAGIDWATVAEKARARGLPCGSPDELRSALFVDGFSTKDSATEYSGRGVGLGAMRAACQTMGGTMTFESTAGVGTCVRLVVPEDAPLKDVSRRSPHLLAVS